MNLQPAIDQLTAEIDKLTSARAALQALTGTASGGTYPYKLPARQQKKTPTLSAAARAKIGAATRARWAAGQMGKQSLKRIQSRKKAR